MRLVSGSGEMKLIPDGSPSGRSANNRGYWPAISERVLADAARFDELAKGSELVACLPAGAREGRVDRIQNGAIEAMWPLGLIEVV
jgi:hypothetical protein